MFKTHPAVKENYFSHIADDESKVTHHGHNFMKEVGELASRAGLEDKQGELVQRIHMVARMHATKGIGVEAYKTATATLLSFLADALGSNLSAEAAKAYKKLLDTMIVVIDKELKVMENE